MLIVHAAFLVNGAGQAAPNANASERCPAACAVFHYVFLQQLLLSERTRSRELGT
jgi:hypothetical protein